MGKYSSTHSILIEEERERVTHKVSGEILIRPYWSVTWSRGERSVIDVSQRLAGQIRVVRSINE